MTVRSTVLSTGFVAGATAGVADCSQPPGCVIGVQVPTGPLGGQTVQLAVPLTFSSEVSAVAQGVAGAVAVTLTALHRTGAASTLQPLLVAVPKAPPSASAPNSIPSRSVPVPRRS
jgi:hypothetical protein